MPYDWITDFAATNDFWTIRSEKVDGAYYTLKQAVSRAKNWTEGH